MFQACGNTRPVAVNHFLIRLPTVEHKLLAIVEMLACFVRIMKKMCSNKRMFI